MYPLVLSQVLSLVLSGGGDTPGPVLGPVYGKVAPSPVTGPVGILSGGIPTDKTGYHSSDRLCRGPYASCGHAGGLSCFT